VLATDVRNGFAGRVSAPVGRDGKPVTVNVYLYNASGSVSGIVYAPDRITPVPHAEVVIGNADGPLTFTVPDEQGAYRQELVPLGDFTVDVFEAATGRRGFGSGRIDLDRQEVPVTIFELGVGLVKGVVLDSGTLAPLSNWTVTLSQRSPAGRSLDSLTTT